MEENDKSIESQINQILGNPRIVEDGGLAGFIRRTKPILRGPSDIAKDLFGLYPEEPPLNPKEMGPRDPRVEFIEDAIERLSRRSWGRRPRTIEFCIVPKLRARDQLRNCIEEFWSRTGNMPAGKILLPPGFYQDLLLEINGKFTWLPGRKREFTQVTAYAGIPIEIRTDLTLGFFAIVGESVLP